MATGASTAGRPDPERLLAAIRRYSVARGEFLAELGLAGSNRDPLAEFSESFVAGLLGGTLADSRVQKGYDLVDPRGRFVEVRYLANPAGHWINEHRVTFTEDLDAYALVLFENLLPVGVVVFPRLAMKAVGMALGKRHPNQDITLQFTRANWRALVERKREFATLGVRLSLPPAWGIDKAQ
jgi:hypothetical protein